MGLDETHNEDKNVHELHDAFFNAKSNSHIQAPTEKFISSVDLRSIHLQTRRVTEMNEIRSHSSP